MGNQSVYKEYFVMNSHNFKSEKVKAFSPVDALRDMGCKGIKRIVVDEEKNNSDYEVYDEHRCYYYSVESRDTDGHL